MTRYLALALDEERICRYDFHGQPLPPHYLVAVAEAQLTVEDGHDMLVALPRIVAFYDTGVPLTDDNPPPLEDLLQAGGWHLVTDSAPDEDVQEVAPADPATVPAAVEYHGDKPLLYFRAGRRMLDTGRRFMTAIAHAVDAATLSCRVSPRGVVPAEELFEPLFDAATQTIDRYLVRNHLTLDVNELTVFDAQHLLTEVCDELSRQLTQMRAESVPGPVNR